MNILEKIVDTVKERVDEYKREKDLTSVRNNAEKYEIKNPYAFYNALNKDNMAFICEVKKASPSKGIIAEDFDYINIASDYESAGADAVSCLTEPYFFKGNDKYIKEIKEHIKIPVLRKDFIINEYMIYQSVILEADALLLIAAILDEHQLKDYVSLTKSLNISSLVEVHDEYELEKALKAECDIIGVNNRDLKTFNVDINNSIRIAKLIPENVIYVSESGIKTYDDIKRLKENNVDAVLIGETLMREKDKSKALKTLRGEI